MNRRQKKKRKKLEIWVHGKSLKLGEYRDWNTYPSLIYDGNTWDKCKDCQFLPINGRCRYTKCILH